MGDTRRGLGIVLKREYVEHVRRKTFVLVTLLGPLLFFALMFVPLIMSLKTRISPKIAEITIVDATGTELGAKLAASIQSAALAAAPPKVLVTAPAGLGVAETLSMDDVRQRRRRGYLVIDSASIRTGQARYVGRNAASVADVGMIQTLLRREVIKERLRAAGVDGPEALSLSAFRADIQTTRVDESGRASRSGRSGMWLGFAVGFALYGLIALYGIAVLRSVTEEKESRAAEIVLSSVSPDALVVGKVLGVGLAAITQVSVWGLSGLLLAKLRNPILARLGADAANATAELPPMPPTLWVVLLLSIVLGFLLYSSLFAMVASTVSNQADAQQAMMPALIPLILGISMVQPTVIHPDAFASRLASWFPLTAPIIMPIRVLIGSPTALEVTGSMLGIAAMTAATLWLSARVYRVTMLMYGKRPTLPEVWRIVRQSA